MGFLDYPRTVYNRLRTATERYDRASASAYGRAVRYDNPLGVKIQTSVSNRFEDSILDLHEAEQVCRHLALTYTCALMTVYSVIWQTEGITDVQKRILIRRAGAKPDTYKQIAADLGIKNEDKARFLDRAATSKIEKIMKGIR